MTDDDKDQVITKQEKLIARLESKISELEKHITYTTELEDKIIELENEQLPLSRNRKADLIEALAASVRN